MATSEARARCSSRAPRTYRVISRATSQDSVTKPTTPSFRGIPPSPTAIRTCSRLRAVCSCLRKKYRHATHSTIRMGSRSSSSGRSTQIERLAVVRRSNNSRRINFHTCRSLPGQINSSLKDVKSQIGTIGKYSTQTNRNKTRIKQPNRADKAASQTMGPSIGLSERKRLRDN